MDGGRLKLAREAAGLSLRDLEGALSRVVTAQAIGKYERGEMAPSQPVLIALAQALSVSPHYLLSERRIAMEALDFRKELKADAKAERATEAAVVDYIDRYVDLEETLNLESIQWTPPPSIEQVPADLADAERAAERLRSLWELGTDPIPDMVELLEEKGIKVFFHPLPAKVFGSQAIARVRLEGGDIRVASIVVNSATTGERQRFTLAHELAHFVMPGISDLEEKLGESYADRFGGAWLVPATTLIEKVGQHRTHITLAELVDLKRYFQVSLQVILIRLCQLGVITKSVAGPFWGMFKAKGWKDGSRDEPERLEPMKGHRLERLCLRALAEDAISESKACELLRISRSQLEALLDESLA
ncbi:MAG: helix-turn-helix domain-containing protein [Lysobacterales bacterium]